MGLVRAYVRMLPSLQADERLQGVQVAQLAGGLMNPEDARGVLRRWSSQASPAAPRQQTNWTAVSQMGLGLRRVVVSRQTETVQ